MEFDVNDENVLSQIDRDLLKTWETKSSYVFLHALDEITLDFRNAFGAGGSFLGEQLVNKMDPFIGSILPRVLMNEAPISAIANGIRRMTFGKNVHYRRLYEI